MRKLLQLALILSMAACAANETPAPTATPKKTTEEIQIELAIAETINMNRALAEGFEHTSNVYTIAFISSLPNEIAGFESSGNVRNWEDPESPTARHGHGFSKRFHYRRGVMWADVFSYHMRYDDLIDLPVGLADPKFIEICEKTLEDILATEGVRWRGITETMHEVITIDGEHSSLPFWRYSFVATRLPEEKPAYSSTFVSIKDRAIVKVRLSYIPTGDIEDFDAEKAATDFMQALVAHMTRDDNK